jgi:hypothetical protein
MCLRKYIIIIIIIGFYHRGFQRIILVLFVSVFVSHVFCLLCVFMFVLFLLLATWLLTQHVNKEELN